MTGPALIGPASRRRGLSAGLLLVGAILWAAPAEANRVGIISRAMQGCGGGNCHAGGASPTVELLAPATAEPGEALDLTLVVSGGQAAAGVNIQVSDGLLEPTDSTLKVQVGQLVHNGSPLDYTDGEARFAFRWTAPVAPGDVVLFASGNSVNNDFLATGDQWGLASATITVVGGGAGGAGGTGGAAGGQPDAGIGGDDGGDSGGDSGCRAQPGHSNAPWALMLVAIALVRTLRRR